MALAFGQTKGKAVSNKIDTYTMVDGDNKVRLIGGVLPRYVYWLKTANGKDIPVECLSFDRDKEKFTNAEVDYVRKAYPAVDSKGKFLVNCQWSYSVNCIDPKDGKVKVFNLKKKLFEQIITTAEDLGDPTDPVTGWDICFKKVKTGAMAFNVEYTLQPFKCKVRPLNEEELAAVAKAKSIDEIYPRPTPDEIQALLEKISATEEEAPDNEAEREAVSDLT